MLCILVFQAECTCFLKICLHIEQKYGKLKVSDWNEERE